MLAKVLVAFSQNDIQTVQSFFSKPFTRKRCTFMFLMSILENRDHWNNKMLEWLLAQEWFYTVDYFREMFRELMWSPIVSYSRMMNLVHQNHVLDELEYYSIYIFHKMQTKEECVDYVDFCAHHSIPIEIHRDSLGSLMHKLNHWMMNLIMYCFVFQKGSRLLTLHSGQYEQWKQNPYQLKMLDIDNKKKKFVHFVWYCRDNHWQHWILFEKEFAALNVSVIFDWFELKKKNIMPYIFTLCRLFPIDQVLEPWFSIHKMNKKTVTDFFNKSKYWPFEKNLLNDLWPFLSNCFITNLQKIKKKKWFVCFADNQFCFKQKSTYCKHQLWYPFKNESLCEMKWLLTHGFLCSQAQLIQVFLNACSNSELDCVAFCTEFLQTNANILLQGWKESRSFECSSFLEKYIPSETFRLQTFNVRTKENILFRSNVSQLEQIVTQFPHILPFRFDLLEDDVKMHFIMQHSEPVSTTQCMDLFCQNANRKKFLKSLFLHCKPQLIELSKNQDTAHELLHKVFYYTTHAADVTFVYHLLDELPDLLPHLKTFQKDGNNMLFVKQIQHELFFESSWTRIPNKTEQCCICYETGHFFLNKLRCLHLYCDECKEYVCSTCVVCTM